MVCIIDSWVPTASTTECALSPSVSFLTFAIPASPRFSTMSVAPNSRANACRSACRGMAMIRSAPSSLAARTASSPTTKSPTLMDSTCSTTPTYSCPVGFGSDTSSEPLCGHGSDPHTRAAASRMIASVGAWMVGSGRSSTRTSPGARITATHQWMTPSKSGEQSKAGSCCQSTLASDGLGVSIVGCTDRASQRSGPTSKRRCSWTTVTRSASS